MTKALTADIHSQEQQHHDWLQSQPELGLVTGLDDLHGTAVSLGFLDAAGQGHHGRTPAVLQQSHTLTTDGAAYETRNRGVYSRFPCLLGGSVDCRGQSRFLTTLCSAMGTSLFERRDTTNNTYRCVDTKTKILLPVQ